MIVLLIMCFTFVSFLGGFYLGRNLNNTPILVSRLPDPADKQNSGVEKPDPTGASETELININTATKEQLQTLPGIGPVLAQRILDYIAENGPFASLSQLTLVSGIGVEKLNDIIDFATVGG